MAAALPMLLMSAVGGIASAAASSLIGGKKSAPAPTPTAGQGPIVMPLADDANRLRARKRSIATQAQRSGRTSTILSGESDKLGG